MARDLGLGITPWGALASGALSGKYTRANHGQLAAGRGAWTTGRLTDATYDLLEILRRTATTHGASVAQVALAWLHARPGVTSIILGARSQAQLGDNLGALAVRLTDEDLDALSAVTAVKHAFPYDFVSTAGNFAYGDAHVDGVAHKRPPYLPELESEVY
jgi:aryl-alcohol dehydrogenase-like predicted oxidoreductase